MRAILYHFSATDPEPGLGIEWHHDRPIYQQGYPIHSEWQPDILVGATLRVRPVPQADGPMAACGGYRLLDIDEDDPEALGKRIIDQLTTLRDAGATYATIVLSLDPDAHA